MNFLKHRLCWLLPPYFSFPAAIAISEFFQKAKDNNTASIHAVVISKEKIFIVNADDVKGDIALGNVKDVYRKFLGQYTR